MYRNVVTETSPDRNVVTETSIDRNDSDQNVMFRKWLTLPLEATTSGSESSG